MSNSEYWRKRFEQVTESELKKADMYQKILEREYQKAIVQIQKDIDTWYNRFAKDNKVTYAESKRMLNSKELQELKWTLDDYIKHGEENNINGKWVQQLKNASARVHISRLESLQIQLQQHAEVVFGNQLDDLDGVLRDIYESGYYHSIFEIQKGLGLGSSFIKLDTARINKVLSKPWADDGRDFSKRIWNNRTKLVNELHTGLTQALIRGEPVEKLAKRLSERFDVSKNRAVALVQTESAYFANAAQQDSFKEIGVDKLEIVGTLDGRTCSTCGAMDGKVIDGSDAKPGITTPPYHTRCRCCTAPAVDEKISERIARGAGGVNYEVPADMKYSDWKKKIDSSVVVDQTQKITKKKNSNAYSVNRQLLNSKEFHDKFENLTDHKATNESVYQEAMQILEHRDGTDMEDIAILDARTGNVIVKNTSSAKSGQTGLTQAQYEIYQRVGGKKVVLHNHPNGGRLSFTDLKTLFVNDDIEATIAVGHDGTVHMASVPNRTIDIEKLYESLYNEYKEIYANSELSRVYALDDLYNLKIFYYESR